MERDITQDMTVGQIAKTYPDLIPELERLGIDYCCGGTQSLALAAAHVQLDPAALATDLSTYQSQSHTAEESQDFASMSMTELADHIEHTHHAYAREALDRLKSHVAKCIAAHGDDEPRLVELQSTLATLTDDMHDHFVREERVLFPWFKRLERPTEIQGGPPWSVKRPIDCMVHDHDEVGVAFTRMRELTDDFAAPDGACSTWRACYRLLSDFERDTHLHIHKENNILFPAGVEAEVRLGVAKSSHN